MRGALGVSDRGHTAVSQLTAGDIDWERLFAQSGVRWFHTGGIFAALSDTTADVTAEALRAAKRHGTVVSYDLNYRPSLWARNGGPARAQQVNRDLVRHVDVLIGNEEDFTACLGIDVDAADPDLRVLDLDAYREMIAEAARQYPNLQVIAITLRGVRSANVNDWTAVAWSRATGFATANPRPNLEIFDRVGGGDSFASGLIFALLTDFDLQHAVEYGAAHGALAMTTPGDTSMASLAEVERLARGADARVQR